MITRYVVLSSLRAADHVFSTYRADSVVSRLNRGEGALEDAPAEVHEVLAIAERARRATDGAFSVWRDGTLDPSAVVKGWAVQRASAALRDLADIPRKGDTIVNDTVAEPAPTGRWSSAASDVALESRGDPNAVSKNEARGKSVPDVLLRALLRRRAREDGPPDNRRGNAESFVVLAYDPRTADTDSYGPYSAASAATECRRRRETLDEGDLEDVIVVVVSLWP